MKKLFLLLGILYAGTSIFAQEKYYELGDQIGHQVKVGNKVVFYVSNTSLGDPDFIYATDGTSEGTEIIGQVEQVRFPNSYLSYPSNGVMNGELYFSAKENEDGDFEVWKTDGTSEGTVKVSEVDARVSADPRYFAPLDGRMYFIANSSFGDEFLNTSALFSLDATGTLRSYPLILSENYRQINDFEIHNGQIYAYSITTDNIYQLDITTGEYSSIAHFETVNYMQSTSLGLFIVASPDALGEYYDGRLYLLNESNQVIELKNAVDDRFDFSTSLDNEAYLLNEAGKIFHEANGRVYYISGIAPDLNGVWSTDGTPEGTQSVYEADLDIFIDNLFTVGEKVYFGDEIDLNGDGFEEASFLMKYDPQTGQTTRVIKDNKLIWLSQRDRVNTIYYDRGFLRADDYMFFPASLVTEEYFDTGDSLYSDLILVLDGTTGGVDILMPDETEIKDKGLMNIIGDNLLFTGWDTESSSIYNDDFFTVDVSEFEVTDTGGTDPGSGPDDDRVVFYEERFYNIQSDTVFIPEGWEITKTANPDYQGNSWSIGGTDLLPVRPQWFDSQILTAPIIDPSFVDGLNAPDEEIVSSPIPVMGREKVSATIELAYNPYFMGEFGVVLNIDARMDEGNWVNVETIQRSGPAAEYSRVDTLELDLSSLDTGSELQFRFRMIATPNSIGPGFEIIFGLDRLKIYEKASGIDDPISYEETTIFEEDFTVDEIAEDSSNAWKVSQTGIDFMFGEEYMWRYQSIPVFQDMDFKFLPGLSEPGFLRLYPTARENWETMETVQYDEIIASPMIEISSSDSLRLSLNTFFHDFIMNEDEIDFRILGRPDTTSDWQTLYEITPKSEPFVTPRAMNLNKVDFNLSEVYSESEIQLGLQIKINNYDKTWYGEGFYVDSLRIYSREQIINLSPVVNNPLDSLILEQDFEEIMVADLNSVFSDPEGEELNFSIASSPDFVTANIEGSSLILSSISGAIGEGDLVLRAEDPKGNHSELTVAVKVSMATSNEVMDAIPDEFTLNQNYPNPFNPTSTIRFGLPEASEVRLDVFNVLGQRVSTLVNGKMQAGWYTVQFEASRLSTGVYIYRIQAGGFIQTKKMMLIK